jgi:hypothetical protein
MRRKLTSRNRFAKLWRGMTIARRPVRNPWRALASSAAEITIEAQQVIWLRLARLGCGAGDLHKEMWLMTAEKPAAFIDAHVAAASALRLDVENHVAAERALAVYRKKVRANLRRLRRGARARA